jgi:hypothetical protein
MEIDNHVGKLTGLLTLLLQSDGTLVFAFP